MKYTIKVVTKVFLKVSALPLLENLMQEKQKLFVAIHQTRTWPVSAKDLLVLFSCHQKSNGFLMEHHKPDAEKKVRGSSAKSHLWLKPRLNFLACFHVCKSREKLQSFTWQAQSQVVPCPSQNWDFRQLQGVAEAQGWSEVLWLLLTKHKLFKW